MKPRSLQLGKFTVTGFREGTFAIDGGAMYGVVPKVIWEKKHPPDSENRIRLGLNSLLVETGRVRILIETGAGGQLTPRLREHYAVEQAPGFLSALEEIGRAPEDIDFVINTHLHFDHCGWNTRREDDGRFVPTFPRAVYLVQKREWEDAVHPVARDKPSYLANTYLPLREHDVLRTIDGAAEITPGVELLPSPGHTAGHQCVLIRSEGETLIFMGDLIPTAGHLGPSYIMSFDLYPLQTYDNKIRLLERAVEEKWFVATSHDPETFFGRIARRGGKLFHLPPA